MRARLVVLLTLIALGCAACGAPSRTTPLVSAVTATVAATSRLIPAETFTASPTPSATPTPVASAPPAPAPVDPGALRTAPRDNYSVPALPRAAGDKTRVVVIDPGHADDEIGAAANGVVEKHSNLDMAFRVEAFLLAQGVRVVMTRRGDVRTYVGPPIAGYSATRRDLQARIDLANDINADIFVSLHSNGSASSADRGVETYWDSLRPFADANRTLASTIQRNVIGEMTNAGISVLDRGAKNDSCLRGFQGRCFPLFLLGPGRGTTGAEVLQRGGTGDQAMTSRPTAMPGALVELLFVSSPADAALLQSEDARNGLARGVARGILEYLNQAPRG